MQQYTYENLVEMGPCWLDEDDGQQRLRDACARLGGTFSIVDVLQAEWIAPEDRIWVATQPGVMADRTQRLFAARAARRALERARADGREPDPRSWAAIETAERYARGEATDEELAAAREAAEAWAAWAVKSAEAVESARTAEREQQVRDLLDLLGDDREGGGEGGS